ncbi:hypothetical protein SAMN05421678_101303 [Actinopolymorpha cephalotaxi]|uniref:Uncharacterized protein n=1 Tax=Actinopolymorpha cephalotaxi TaxID=504797 RepID=A0A1I2KLY4_9ACTN|nr:hypothetical protein [Actinopolymorpha cephalotaxi]NYH84446.1 hypothetical protein [Actinopolymorpha cephalotaxi]SFF66237.1 hypothetical protein SAMN05421678_101303 [Actinopolymorpha cephalotaxi]
MTEAAAQPAAAAKLSICSQPAAKSRARSGWISRDTNPGEASPPTRKNALAATTTSGTNRHQTSATITASARSMNGPGPS